MYDSASRQIILNTYDQLVYYNREHTDQFVPAVAESWDVSADGLSYVFNIRDGVPYHQGGTVEAMDAAYAWWRLLLQDRAGGPGWMLLEPVLGASSIEGYAIDKANEAMGM
jgi:peptide/nickel transport system substrate-binding protein